MGNRFLNYAEMCSFGLYNWRSLEQDMMWRKPPPDTSATRKARKERARELTRQREQELREKNKKQDSFFTPLLLKRECGIICAIKSPNRDNKDKDKKGDKTNGKDLQDRGRTDQGSV